MKLGWFIVCIIAFSVISCESHTDNKFSSKQITNKLLPKPAKHFKVVKANVTDTLYRIYFGNLWGYINQAGDVVIAPQYHSVADFSEGLAAVRKGGYYGYINTLNEYIILPRFDYAEDFSEGFAVVQKDSFSYIIDRDGKNLLNYKLKDASGFSNGVCAITDLSGNTYCINKLGKKVTCKPIVNTYEDATYSTASIMPALQMKYEYMTKFVDGRAFAGTFGKWHLVNEKGNKVTDTIFDQIDDNGFVKGLAIVEHESNEMSGIIDIEGRYVVKPQFNYLYHAHKEKQLYLTSDGKLHGIIDRNGNYLAKPIYTKTARQFDRNLLYVEKDSLYGYLNQFGKLVWSEVDPYWHDSIRKQYVPDTLNLDYMEFTNYSVYGTKDTVEGSDGWAESGNFEKKLSKDIPVKKNRLYVEITNIPTRYYGFAGRTVRIINATKDTAEFKAQDSDLYLMLQAKDSTGEWRNIQYMMSSFCGNSNHYVHLPPNHYWEVPMPIYGGTVKTKFRYVLNKNPKRENNVQIISNEVDGFVNSSQFWRTNRYRPSNIMDPYAH